MRITLSTGDRMAAVVRIQGEGAGGLQQQGCRTGGEPCSDLRKTLKR